MNTKGKKYNKDNHRKKRIANNDLGIEKIDHILYNLEEITSNRFIIFVKNKLL